MDNQALQSVYKAVESNANTSELMLNEAISIPSISSLPSNQNDLSKMAKWTQQKFSDLGFNTTYIDGVEYKENGSKTLYPFVIGERNEKTAFKTLLIYGHLDVVAASKSDGWDQKDPFELDKDDNGFLRGRGSTDDKGPLIAWLSALQAINSINASIGLNLKLLFETGEEIGSPGLRSFIEDQKNKGYLQNIDYLVVSDNYWLKPNQPCLTYGLRGMVYFVMTIDGISPTDLHSGVYGGIVPEPMAETIALLASLTDVEGKITVNGFYDKILPFKEVERGSYAKVHLDESSIGLDPEKMNDTEIKIKYLANRWRWPTLSIHGIEGSVSGKDDYKAIIPHQIIAKFSVRLVPDMDPADIKERVIKHLEAEHNKWTQVRPGNKMIIKTRDAGAPAWYNEPWGNPIYEAGQKAISQLYGGIETDLTREGGSIPAVLELSKILKNGSNAILLPITTNDGAHSQNEKIRQSDLINGAKLMATFLYELAKL